jgi:hypothetical protein
MGIGVAPEMFSLYGFLNEIGEKFSLLSKIEKHNGAALQIYLSCKCLFRVAFSHGSK